MKTVGLVAATCALLVVLTGCGGGAAGSAEPTPAAGATSVTDELARADSPVTRSGERRPLAEGLTITVSAPKSFVPSASASAGVEAKRAVGFEMTVRNDGPALYRSASLSLTAMVNGELTQQVIDSTQGYTGVVGASDVPPGGSMRFSVAFAVPAETVSVLVSAQPDTAGGPSVTVFDGST
ncbi:hypothetical protein V5P93_001320 [Actinokineospora auranticolor]|uniref:DUF4352 domain-containing protein n=1 Tax=Actinokineospora auranticolor TaxID=155976 RepID=A0A2S6GUR4_9PSEU|nr:hypothetical protein [Actinokineospora auranticolor]PPK68950.1 hypothetical protein CLV40_104194 [Actinokineospora auranticolor]